MRSEDSAWGSWDVPKEGLGAMGGGGGYLRRVKYYRSSRTAVEVISEVIPEVCGLAAPQIRDCRPGSARHGNEQGHRNGSRRFPQNVPAGLTIRMRKQ